MYRMTGMTVGTGIIAGLFIASPAFALGTNGGFESGSDPGSYLQVNAGDITTITGWSVDTGSVDYIGTYWQTAEGSRSIDLNGVEKGAISQVVPTIPGATYTVTFSLSGNPDSVFDQSNSYLSPSVKQVTVAATGATPQPYTYDTSSQGNSLTDMKWQTKTYTFTATQSQTTLSFASDISGAFGPAIDKVAITERVPAAASCPSNTVKTLVETVQVPSNKSTPTQTATVLTNGTQYLFEATGTWENIDKNVADAQYASVDNWTSQMQGYNIAPYSLGVNEFALQVNGGFVAWGPYNGTHTYDYLYSGTGATAGFMVFDGDSNVPQVNTDWYGDNNGSLTVKVYQCAAKATVTGTVYNDPNRNHKKDTGETGLQGWTVRLINLKKGTVITTTTDATGAYSFTNIPDGTYVVRERHQQGWHRTTKNPKPIVLTGGSVVTTVDFGNAQVKKNEKCDTDADDDMTDLFGTFFTHGDRSDYGTDPDSRSGR